MAKDPVCPIYYNDLLGATRDWDDEEFGAYVRLLLEQWDKTTIPNPCQNSANELPDFRRLLRISTSVDKHWELISSKFKVVEGGLQNENMEEIREKREKFKEKQKENALKRYQTTSQKSAKVDAKNLPLEEENENEKERELESRKGKFFLAISVFRNLYSENMLNEFCEYWTEHNEGGLKMRFEMEKVFDKSKRLKTWASRQKFKSNGKQNDTEARRSELDSLQSAIRSVHSTSQSEGNK